MITRGHYGKATNIATATTTVIKNGNGVLHSIVLNEVSAGAITVYDNTAASGTIIATIATAAPAGTVLPYNCQFSTGLTIVTAGADDITVTWS